MQGVGLPHNKKFLTGERYVKAGRVEKGGIIKEGMSAPLKHSHESSANQEL